jgi:hypothetical protein
VPHATQCLRGVLEIEMAVFATAAQKESIIVL